jgi:hypothetical protein
MTFFKPAGAGVAAADPIAKDMKARLLARAVVATKDFLI